MALSQRTQKQLLEAAAPMRVVPAPLRPVPSAPLNDTLGEEFLFAGGSLTAPSSRAVKIRPRAPVLGVIAVGLAIVLVLVVRSLTASKPEPTRVPVKLAPTAAQPAPAPAVIPMSIVTSSLRPSAARSYSASVTVRNPTDVAADDVSVHVTLRDASGRVVATQTRSLGTVPSGKTVNLTVAGELDPSAGAPTALEVSAVAARLEAPA